jgi:DNA-binding NtrC family response regulator
VKQEGTVLIVENEANMRRVLATLLRRDGLQIVEAADGQQGLERLAAQRIDAIVTDLKMPRMNGLELLEEVCKRHREVPVILLTAFGTVGSAVEALKQGAFDYLTKPFDPDEIRQVVAKALRTRALQESEASPELEDDPESLLIGESAALHEVRRLIDRVGPTKATVSITGESGSGKELVARSLHLRSPRVEAPFIKINCAAIPQSLLESELFGHEKGAFTGAASRKPGRFELADGGTLFLDEIGEMPLSAQPKLLRAIQEGRFYRVGGTRTVEVDVRLIAATNRDLHVEVREGRFREDLFYRLNVVPIRVPALRERAEDIPVLAELFMRRFGRKQKKRMIGITDEAVAALRAHVWPGNIRELENAIERALLLSDGEWIGAADLPPEIAEAGHRAAQAGGVESLRDRVKTETRRIEREAILDALRRTGGNVTHAAERLGLSRRGLQLKMKELDIRVR